MNLKHYAGHVPTGRVFKLHFDEIVDLVESSHDPDYTSNINAQISLIALIAYFEAFCKNNFASIINICPELIENFLVKRKEITINLKDLILFDYDVKNKIGFIISEKYDFGSAKCINNLYNDLLSISPFTKKEISTFDALLNDRNLLVHHGGIYTLKYGHQKLESGIAKNEIYAQSVRIRKGDFLKSAEFIEKVVLKILDCCNTALIDYISKNKIILSTEQEKSLLSFKRYENNDYS